MEPSLNSFCFKLFKARYSGPGALWPARCRRLQAVMLKAQKLYMKEFYGTKGAKSCYGANLLAID
jgi:hypothetical protein